MGHAQRTGACRRGVARLTGLLLGGAILLPVMAVPAVAAPAQEDAQQQFDIQAGPLGAALLQLGTQSGLQFNVDSQLTEGKTAPAVNGRHSVEQVLRMLLAGSGLNYRFTGPQTVVIEALPDTGGARVLGAVRVEGAGGTGSGGGSAAAISGINGSRDVTATEGSGSYTTNATRVATKAPQALVDTPQSVSVVTNQRLVEQNINDFSDLMTQMPGVSTVTGTAGPLNPEFYSRGFRLQRLQIDGGAPIDIASDQFGLNPQLDMAIYDHAEIVRGVDGQFNGYGDPGGVISLSRKQPLDQAQSIGEVQVGSWNNYRITADITGPITRNGRIRGRGVVVWQDQDFFYDLANTRKGLFYGTLDFDVTSSTLVNIGATHTTQRGLPFTSGLPRFANGDDLRLPRSTCLCAPINRYSIVTNEVFGRVEQKLGGDWNLLINGSHIEQTSRSTGVSISGAVNPVTRDGAEYSFVRTKDASTQDTLDATINGTFELFGLRQRVVLGANYADSNGGGSEILVDTDAQQLPIDILAFNPDTIAGTRTGTFVRAVLQDPQKKRQIGAYATLGLSVWAPLTINVGIRYSKLRYDRGTTFFCALVEGCTNFETGVVTPLGEASGGSQSVQRTDDVSWPPNLSGVLKLTKNLSAYVSYADIFQEQASFIDASLTPLTPIRGTNWEGGVKWAPNNGRLNLSVSGFRIRQRNIAKFDGFPEDDAVIPPSLFCCYVIDPDNTRQSEGVEAEVAGEVMPGWQLSANYTWTRDRFVGEGTFQDGDPLVSQSPAHLIKVWTSFQLPRKDWLGRVNLGFGVNAQSSSYDSGFACPRFNTDGSCAVRRQFFEFTQAGYAVVAVRLAYQIDRNVSLSVNVNNLLDKRYYQTVAAPSNGNWYGEPRSVLALLRARY